MRRTRSLKNFLCLIAGLLFIIHFRTWVGTLRMSGYFLLIPIFSFKYWKSARIKIRRKKIKKKFSEFLFELKNSSLLSDSPILPKWGQTRFTSYSNIYSSLSSSSISKLSVTFLFSSLIIQYTESLCSMVQTDSNDNFSLD